MRCQFCHGVGEVLIDRNYKIVRWAHEATMMIPCPNGCTGGIAFCCEGERPDCAPDTNQGQNDG